MKHFVLLLSLIHISNLRMENDSTITGYKLVKGWGPERHIYFTATFSKKLTGLRFMQNKKPVIYNTSRFRSSYEAWGKNLMACISFDTKAGEEVIVKTAISSVSTNGAKNNMAELAGLTFDDLKAKGEALWEKELGKYTLTADRKTKRTFYTSAYHAALHPFIFQDADGQFRGCLLYTSMELIRKMPTSIVPVTNIGTRPLLALVTLILSLIHI